MDIVVYELCGGVVCTLCVTARCPVLLFVYSDLLLVVVLGYVRDVV